MSQYGSLIIKMLTAIKSIYDHVRSYLEDIGEAVMPQLYLLKRGLGSIRSADDHMIFFNSPTNDGRSATVNGIHVTLEGMKRVQDELVEDIEGRLDNLLWGSFRFPMTLKFMTNQGSFKQATALRQIVVILGTKKARR